MYPFEEDDDAMKTRRSNLDDGQLLGLIQETVKEWKSAEDYFSKQCDVYTLKDKNYARIQELKDLYESLIREAKDRNLALSKEKLISQIIYTHSDKDRLNKT